MAIRFGSSGGISSSIDWLRKNEKRGDKLDIDDYGIVYDVNKEVPRIKSGNNQENQEIKIIVPFNELWIVKGVELIIELTSEPFVISGSGAKLIIQYPLTQSKLSVEARTIVVDLENQGIAGLLHLCDFTSDNKPQIFDFSNQLGKKYISAFLNLNYVILDYEQSSNALKQIVFKTENITPLVGINGVIYIKPIGWKIKKTDW